ncbi:hypothetical protein GCM10027299_03170 [Larkinella ripae]
MGANGDVAPQIYLRKLGISSVRNKQVTYGIHGRLKFRANVIVVGSDIKPNGKGRAGKFALKVKAFRPR